MSEALTLIALCLAFLVVWVGLSFASAHDGEWHAWGYRMRRWTRNGWEYRNPTPEEEQERRDRSAW